MESYILETQEKKGGVRVNEFVQKMISKGRSEGRSEGRNEGILLAANRMSAIMSGLYAEGRDEEVKKALSDSAYLEKLIREYRV